MALVLPDVAEAEWLKRVLKDVNNQTLKLFVNNKTPAEGDVAGDYTEMSTHSYAAKTLAKADWTIATVVNVTSATQPQQTWTFTSASAVTVYGYFIVDAVTGLLLWAEKFTYAQVVLSVDTPIKLTPIISLD